MLQINGPSNRVPPSIRILFVKSAHPMRCPINVDAIVFPCLHLYHGGVGKVKSVDETRFRERRESTYGEEFMPQFIVLVIFVADVFLVRETMKLLVGEASDVRGGFEVEGRLKPVTRESFAREIHLASNLQRELARLGKTERERASETCPSRPELGSLDNSSSICERAIRI